MKSLLFYYNMDNCTLYIQPKIKKDNGRFSNGRFKKGHNLNSGFKKREFTDSMKNAVMKNLEKAKKSRMEYGSSYFGRRCVGIKPDKTFTVFQSCRYAQKIVGVTNGRIALKCNGKIKSRYACGYFWFWEDDSSWYDFMNNLNDDIVKKAIEEEEKQLSRFKNRRIKP